jgi:hypothetical protein
MLRVKKRRRREREREKEKEKERKRKVRRINGAKEVGPLKFTFGVISAYRRRTSSKPTQGRSG